MQRTEGVGSRGYRYGTERRSLAVKERLGEMRFVTARKGSRGTDVMGRVGCGAAGSLQRIGRAITGTERWGLAVGERSGCDRFRRVCFGMAVMDGQCVDVLGPVRYEEAVEEFNG